jgi:hypothetical protein
MSCDNLNVEADLSIFGVTYVPKHHYLAIYYALECVADGLVKGKDVRPYAKNILRELNRKRGA